MQSFLESNYGIATRSDGHVLPQPVAPVKRTLCEEHKSVYDIIASSSVHTMFLKLINFAGLKSTLSCVNTHTVFAPNDNAFREISIGTIGDSVSSVMHNGVEITMERLRHLILHHVVEGSFCSKKLATVDSLMSDAGHRICVTRMSGNIFVNMTGRDIREAAIVIKADIKALNKSIVHVIDRLLLDPKSAIEPISRSVYEIICQNPHLKIFKSLIDAAELQTTLGDCGTKVTVFAPSDCSFEKVTKAHPGCLEVLLRNKEELQGVILAHVVKGQYFTTQLQNRQVLPTLDTRTLQIRRCDNHMYIVAEGASFESKTAVQLLPAVIHADLIGNNGVVNVVDRVISVNKKSVFHTLKSNGHFQILTCLLEEAGLHNTLDDCLAKFTVFAPLDETVLKCITKAEMMHLKSQPEVLKKFLLSHVLGVRALSNEIPDEVPLETLSGKNIIADVHRDGRYVHLQGSTAPHSKIVQANIIAYNGVIHAIQCPLLMGCAVKKPCVPCVEHTPPCAHPKKECADNGTETGKIVVPVLEIEYVEVENDSSERRDLSPLPRSAPMMSITPLVLAVSTTESPTPSVASTPSSSSYSTPMSAYRRALSPRSGRSSVKSGQLTSDIITTGNLHGETYRQPDGSFKYYINSVEVPKERYDSVNWLE